MISGGQCKHSDAQETIAFIHPCVVRCFTLYFTLCLHCISPHVCSIFKRQIKMQFVANSWKLQEPFPKYKPLPRLNSFGPTNFQECTMRSLGHSRSFRLQDTMY